MMRVQGMCVAAAILAAAGCSKKDKDAPAPSPSSGKPTEAAPPSTPPHATTPPAAPAPGGAAPVNGGIASTTTAQPDAWLITPGKSIGKIELGMSEADVEKALSKPSVARTYGGVRVMVWFGANVRPEVYAQPEPDQTSADMKPIRETAVALLEHDKVVQIEVSAPIFHTADGKISTGKTVDAMTPAMPGAGTDVDNDELGNADEGGATPAAKHILSILDDKAQGVAVAYGSWGDLHPDPDPDHPEAIIVHAAGAAAIANPLNGLPYAGHSAKSYDFKPRP